MVKGTKLYRHIKSWSRPRDDWKFFTSLPFFVSYLEFNFECMNVLENPFLVNKYFSSKGAWLEEEPRGESLVHQAGLRKRICWPIINRLMKEKLYETKEEEISKSVSERTLKSSVLLWFDEIARTSTWESEQSQMCVMLREAVLENICSVEFNSFSLWCSCTHLHICRAKEIETK